MIMPHACQGDRRFFAGPAGRTGSVRGSASVDTMSALPREGEGRIDGQPATALMRAIISSTALSTGTFSFTTRFIALAQTFSLLMIVNL